MTAQIINDFAARLDADREFSGQFSACLDAAPEGTVVAVAVAFAAANGFATTPDEMARFLEAAVQRNSDLPDKALDDVSGGLPVFALSPDGWNRNGLWKYR